jgi:hypothetical protein
VLLTRTIFIIAAQLFFGTCLAAAPCNVIYGKHWCVRDGDIIEAGSLKIKLKEHSLAKYPSDTIPGKESYEIESRWMYLVDIKAPGFINRDIKLWQKLPVTLEICGKDVTITFPDTCIITISDF